MEADAQLPGILRPQAIWTPSSRSRKPGHKTAPGTQSGLRWHSKRLSKWLSRSGLDHRALELCFDSKTRIPLSQHPSLQNRQEFLTNNKDLLYSTENYISHNNLIGKDPDAGKDWGQEEKGETEDEMGGWHHQLNGYEFEQTLGDGEGQGGLEGCSPWGHKESDMTEEMNNK